MSSSSFLRSQLAANEAAQSAAPGQDVVWRSPAGSTYNGVRLEVGEVLPLAGAANDQKLLRNRMAEPLGGREPVACGSCPKRFVNVQAALAHMLREHGTAADAAADPEGGEPRSASSLVNVQAARGHATPADAANDAESNAPRSASSSRGRA